MSTIFMSRFAPHLKVMTYGSGGKEAREGQREEITSTVAQQPGGWTKASFPFHVLLCHYEVSIKCCTCMYIASFPGPIPTLKFHAEQVWPLKILEIGPEYYYCYAKLSWYVYSTCRS